MARNGRIFSIELMHNLLINEEFNKYITGSKFNGDAIQTNINLSNAINMLYTGATVARPILSKIMTTDGLANPAKEIVIEFDNKIYNISKRKYRLGLERIINDDPEEIEDECLIPKTSFGPTYESYLIRNEIYRMIHQNVR